MGIKGLNKLLERHAPDALGEITLDKLKGTRIAIDAYNWIHTNYPNAKKEVINRTDVSVEDPNEGEIFKEWMNLLFDFIKKWLNYSITPVFVFDGTAPMEKNKTREKRREDQRKVYERMLELKDEVRNGDPLLCTPEKIVELRKKMINTRSITMESINYMRDMLTSLGIPTIQAKYEGEQLCSMLARKGIVSAVFSTDTDNLVYGSPLMLTRFSGLEWTPKGGVYKCKCVWLKNALQQLNYTQSKFVDLCILAGCDYNVNMKKIGVFTAYKHLNVYQNIDAFPPEKFDTSCLLHRRCREMFSPVQLEDIWEDGFLNYQMEKIACLVPCLEGLGIYEQHYYLVTLLHNLEQPQDKTLSPPPIPRRLKCTNITLNIIPVQSLV